MFIGKYILKIIKNLCPFPLASSHHFFNTPIPASPEKHGAPSSSKSWAKAWEAGVPEATQHTDPCPVCLDLTLFVK